MATELVSALAQYRILPEESTFTVQAFAEGLFSAFGHDPVIAVRSFNGNAEFMPETFEKAALHLSVDASSLVVANEVKEKDRLEIENTMRREVLEVQTYPEIKFDSNNVALNRLGPGRYRARLIGDLSLHGVTQKNVWITAEVTLSAEMLRAKGEYQLRQTDFKVKPVSVAGGTLKIKNELKCAFDICAKPA
ncbi:MAG TPA: YceI family protein [Pyrinomonadaceae bacterium]|nr:YceI family protein [Pyrinomonadaceae bacterium]